MLSRRAWMVLGILFLLSLVMSAVSVWTISRFIRPRFVLVHPGFGAPWERWEPRERHRGPSPLPWESRFRDKHSPFLPYTRVLSRVSPWWSLGRVAASEAFLFLIGALVVGLVPHRIRRMLAALSAEGRGFTLFGLGVLVGILTLTLVILAVFSIIGWAFLPLLLVFLALAWGIGLVAVTLEIGRRIRQWTRVPDTHTLLDLAYGVLALFIVGSVPILGLLALLLAGLWGLGAVFATRGGSPEGWMWNLAEQESASSSGPKATPSESGQTQL